MSMSSHRVARLGIQVRNHIGFWNTANPRGVNKSVWSGGSGPPISPPSSPRTSPGRDVMARRSVEHAVLTLSQHRPLHQVPSSAANCSRKRWSSPPRCSRCCRPHRHRQRCSSPHRPAADPPFMGERITLGGRWLAIGIWDPWLVPNAYQRRRCMSSHIRRSSSAFISGPCLAWTPMILSLRVFEHVASSAAPGAPRQPARVLTTWYIVHSGSSPSGIANRGASGGCGALRGGA